MVSAGSMSLVAHQFGHVKFRIFDVVSFRKLHLKISKQTFKIINSKFDTSKLMSGQEHVYACKFSKKYKFISVSGFTQNLSNCCSHKYDQSISINFCPTLKRPFYFRPNPRWILTPILPL